MVVSPSTTAEAPITTRWPSTTCGPTTACGPTTVPAPMIAPGCTERGPIDQRLVGGEGQHQAGLDHDLAVDVGDGMDAGDRAAPAGQPDVEREAIAGHHLAAELHVVDAAQDDARRRRRVVAVEQQQAGRLGQRFEHQHAGQQRHAREVAGHELFAAADQLGGAEVIGAVGRHRVHEHGRKPEPLALEEGDDAHA